MAQQARADDSDLRVLIQRLLRVVTLQQAPQVARIVVQWANEGRIAGEGGPPAEPSTSAPGGASAHDTADVRGSGPRKPRRRGCRGGGRADRRKPPAAAPAEQLTPESPNSDISMASAGAGPDGCANASARPGAAARVLRFEDDAASVGSDFRLVQEMFGEIQAMLAQSGHAAR